MDIPHFGDPAASKLRSDCAVHLRRRPSPRCSGRGPFDTGRWAMRTYWGASVRLWKGAAALAASCGIGFIYYPNINWLALSPNTLSLWAPATGSPNGWFTRQNPMNMDDLGVPQFVEPPKWDGLWLYGIWFSSAHGCESHRGRWVWSPWRQMS